MFLNVLFMFKNPIQDTMINHHISSASLGSDSFLDSLSFNEFDSFVKHQYQNCQNNTNTKTKICRIPLDWLLSDIILLIKLRLLQEERP